MGIFSDSYMKPLFVALEEDFSGLGTTAISQSANSLLWRTMLYLAGCSAASRSSPYYMPVVLLPGDNQKCFQTLPNVS